MSIDRILSLGKMLARGRERDLWSIARATKPLIQIPPCGEDDESASQEDQYECQGQEKALLQHIVLIDVAVKGSF